MGGDHTAALDRVLDRCRLQGDPTLSKREACRLCAERPICPVARSYGHLAAYLDLPTCVSCGSRSCVPLSSYDHANHVFAIAEAGVIDNKLLLLCATCGWCGRGTAKQIEQANRAEQAWTTRTDGRHGPWMSVVRRRAKRRTQQLGLFVPRKEPTDE